MHVFGKATYHNRAPDNTFFTTCHSLRWRWRGRKFCLVLSVGLQFSLYFGAGKHFSSELLFCKRLQSLIYFRGRNLLCFLLNTKLELFEDVCSHSTLAGRSWKKVQAFEHPCLRQSYTKRKYISNSSKTFLFSGYLAHLT